MFKPCPIIWAIPLKMFGGGICRTPTRFWLFWDPNPFLAYRPSNLFASNPFFPMISPWYVFTIILFSRRPIFSQDRRPFHQSKPPTLSQDALISYFFAQLYPQPFSYPDFSPRLVSLILRFIIYLTHYFPSFTPSDPFLTPWHINPRFYPQPALKTPKLFGWLPPSHLLMEQP